MEENYTFGSFIEWIGNINKLENDVEFSFVLTCGENNSWVNLDMDSSNLMRRVTCWGDLSYHAEILNVNSCKTVYNDLGEDWSEVRAYDFLYQFLSLERSQSISGKSK